MVVLNQQRMFPYLAEGIADLVLPPGKVAPEIEDTDAALTARLRAVLASAAEGRPIADAIAETSRTELVRMLEEMGPIVIGMLDPIQGLELIEERREAGRWTRKYRVMFGQAARYWLFELTADGKIAAMRPVSE